MSRPFVPSAPAGARISDRHTAGTVSPVGLPSVVVPPCPTSHRASGRRGAARVALIGALLAGPRLQAQQGATPQPVSMMHALGVAAAAVEAGALDDAVALLQAGEAFSPGHPRLLHALARLHLQRGDPEAALAALARLAPIGVASDLTADSSLAALRAHPGFAPLAARLARGAAPLVRSDTAALIADGDLVPESVARDPVDGTYYVGSLARRTVVRVRPGARAGGAAEQARTEALVPPRADGVGRVLGVKLQPGTRRLWVLNWVPDARAPRSIVGDAGWAQLHVYDLARRRLVRRLALRDTVGAHLLNDLAFAPSGDAYITDSHGGRLYRLRAGRDSLEPITLVDDAGGRVRLTYPNGIALRGGALYVAHVDGLVRVALPRGQATRAAATALPAVRVAASAEHFAGGIDGLYACGPDLVGIQDVVDHQRVVRLSLDPSGTRVSELTVLERRHPAADLPTTGVRVGDALVYVANSRLRRLQQDDTLLPADHPGPTVLLRLPLPGGCRSGQGRIPTSTP